MSSEQNGKERGMQLGARREGSSSRNGHILKPELPKHTYFQGKLDSSAVMF